MELGYAQTSTLEIATRARVSKRELYGLVGNKQAMLVACIAARASRMQIPAGMPMPRDREALSEVLTSLGAHLLREVIDPAVIAVFRLAIAEAGQAPEVARALDTTGRETIRTALRQMFTHARALKLLDGDPADMAGQFTALLWGNLMMNLLLQVADTPNPGEIKRRARNATAALLQLYPAPRATPRP